MPRTRIKICGLTRRADVLAAVEAGADAVGFVRFAGSARCVGAAEAAELARGLPPFVTPVLLYVNAALAQVRAERAAIPGAIVQFHGDEPAAQCEALGSPYLRAVPMAPGVALLDWAERHPGAAALLLDAPSAGYGGAGKVFDWSVVPPRGVPLPLVLSGGLNAANVTDGVRRLRPHAVDVSSGVEAGGKGKKDAALMRQFCAAVRRADEALAADGAHPTGDRS
jgi:phosphoribosylanthranilate isomerase